MAELLIYSFIFIVIVIFLIAYLKNNKIFEGLENSTGSSASKPVSSSNVTGVGAPSQLYDQSVTNSIATLDTELNMTTYSSQYLQIINNMRELYKRKALKVMLQTPLNESAFIFQTISMLTSYEGALKTLDTLEDFVNSSSKTTKLGMWG